MFVSLSKLLHTMEKDKIGTGFKAQFIELIDNLLRTRKGFISNDDIYLAFAKEQLPDEYSKHGEGIIQILSKLSKYSTPNKKAKQDIKECLKKQNKDLEEIKKGKKVYFKYPDNLTDDPIASLREDNRKLRLKTLEDMIQRSSGLFPKSWLANFKLQMEEEINEISGKKSQIIEFDTNSKLKNLALLPTLYYAIRDEQVVEFTYQPFAKKERTYIFHPHYLREYNSRWFVFGRATRKDNENVDESCNCALDRIVGDIIPKENDTYLPSTTDYTIYFDDIIGVTHDKKSQKEHIVIQTNDAYTHGRILTKPLHKSQKEIQTFDPTTRQGRVSLDVKPNKELLGMLFSFESHIKVLEPKNYLDKFREETIKLHNIYK